MNERKTMRWLVCPDGLGQNLKAGPMLLYSKPFLNLVFHFQSYFLS